jgi:hypothetical protein
MANDSRSSSSSPILFSGIASVMSLVLSLFMTGCLGTLEAGEADSEDLVEWQSGEWWRYNVIGTLPAPWMDRTESQFRWARDLGHEISIAVNQAATFVAVPDPFDLNGDVFSGPPTTIMADDPTMEHLGTYGLPLATTWDFADGISLGVLGERYNKVGSMIHGTMFLSWPLADGKSWETSFMSRDLVITATLQDGMFILVAESGGDVLLRYGYDPDVRWFSFFEIMDGSGKVQLTAELLDHGVDGFKADLYQISNGSYSVWCVGGQEISPVSLAACLVGNIAIRTYPGGQSLFFYYLAYRSEGPGFQSLVHVSNPQQAPEVLNFETCPCDTERHWVDPVGAPGVHSWETPGVFSGEDKWMYFFIFYACQGIYRMDGTELHVVDRCNM